MAEGDIVLENESKEKPMISLTGTRSPKAISPLRKNAEETIKDTFLFTVVDALSDIEDFVFKTVANPFSNRSQEKTSKSVNKI